MSYQISKNTRLCISLAGEPRSTGTRFHNFLYAQSRLDYIYKACTTNDLASAIAGIRALGIRCCDMSTPIKEACIPHLDRLDLSSPKRWAWSTPSSTTTGTCAATTPTISPSASCSTSAACRLCCPSRCAAPAGSLGPSPARSATRGSKTGSSSPATAAPARIWPAEHGYRWQPGLGEERPGLLVNVTPIGMAGGLEAEDMPFAALVDAAGAVMDMVAMPARTPLIRYAEAHGKLVITGAEVIALQAAEEFALCVRGAPGR